MKATPNQPRGSTPVPDPTELTARAVADAVDRMREYVDGKVAQIETRLDGADTATTLRLEVIDALPAQIVREVSHLELLHDEKFRSVDQRFTERDIRSEREARDNKVAVDAAFAAQKEAAAKQDEANAKAIDKSEKATAETIKTNQELSRSVTDGLTKDTDSLKLAVSRIESQKVGATEQRVEHTDNRIAIYTTIGLIVTLIIAGILVLAFLVAESQKVTLT